LFIADYFVEYGILPAGYGQTEGAAAATISHPYDVATVGHVGGPTPTVEIALYDVPEMKYISTDTNHFGKSCYGRGEICIRGPNVFVGYYKDIEKTKETIDEEGWLHSGDIGLWRVDGTLQIIDRKKNIFKLSQGEYVAPEKIENILLRSQFIAQAFVYGDSLKSRLVAIIIPDEDVAKQWFNNIDEDNSSDNNITYDLKNICDNKTFQNIILQSIQQISKDAKLNGFETVFAIHLSHIPFSVENDLLTPTFKLKRQQARDMYQQEIDRMYQALPNSKL
jgi:long-chain acyl-CoA synthetase